MKKTVLFWTAVLMLTILLAGCGAPGAEEPVTTNETVSATAETTNAATEAASAETEEKHIYAGDDYAYYMDIAYAEQIARYHTALSEKWSEGQYFENGMSALPYYYYDGNPLDNVGFGFVDLDNDGSWELVIGAIVDAEEAPAVFEIWTLVDGKPIMLAQANARCQYSLVYAEEDNMWYVANECSSGNISCHGIYYMMLTEGKFEVMQGVIYNAEADDKNPWFMTYDMDWDAANDEPIDEDMAHAIRESHQQYYVALEYFSYIYY